MLNLLYITSHPEAAQYAVACGVNRIFVDLEYMGKAGRQAGRDTHLAQHTPQDVAAVRAALEGTDGEVLARCNPWGSHSPDEIAALLEAGADWIMLPMFTTPEEVESFIAAVGGRARTVLLLETAPALARLPQVLEAAREVDEIFVGLNDLHLGLGLDFMFEVLTGGLVEYVARAAQARELSFGFGGIARVGRGAVPAEMVLGEHVRLGSRSVILSRDFPLARDRHEEHRPDFDLAAEIRKIRDWEARYAELTTGQLLENATALRERVAGVVGEIRRAKDRA